MCDWRLKVLDSNFEAGTKQLKDIGRETPLSSIMKFLHQFFVLFWKMKWRTQKSIVKKYYLHQLKQIDYIQKSVTVTTVLVSVLNQRSSHVFYHPLSSYSSLLTFLIFYPLPFPSFQFLHVLLGSTHHSLSAKVTVERTQPSALHHFLYCYSSCDSSVWSE